MERDDDVAKEKKFWAWLFWLGVSCSLGCFLGATWAWSLAGAERETEIFEEQVAQHGCVLQPHSVLLKSGLGRTCNLPGGAVVVEHPSKL